MGMVLSQASIGTINTIILIIVSVVLTLYLLALTINEFHGGVVPISQSSIINPTQLSVQGHAVVTVVPDVAVFSFTVDENSPLIEDAVSRASRKNNMALIVLQQAGIHPDDLQTTQYTVQPAFDYTMNPVVPKGFDVRQTTRVKVRDIMKVSSIIASITALEIQYMNTLSFEVDLLEEQQSKAQTLAILNAKANAQILATQLGVQIGRILEFSYEFPTTDQYNLRTGIATQSAQNPSVVMVGQQSVQSSVTITYAFTGGHI